jgi:hypothetical protein
MDSWKRQQKSGKKLKSVERKNAGLLGERM